MTRVTVTEALVLRPLQEDRWHITESIRILVPVDRLKQKCFQITTKRGIYEVMRVNNKSQVLFALKQFDMIGRQPKLTTTMAMKMVRMAIDGQNVWLL